MPGLRHARQCVYAGVHRVSITEAGSLVWVPRRHECVGQFMGESRSPERTLAVIKLCHRCDANFTSVVNFVKHRSVLQRVGRITARLGERPVRKDNHEVAAPAQKALDCGNAQGDVRAAVRAFVHNVTNPQASV